MSWKTWLVVGSSRGIGHEFVKQALERGDRVVATVRERKPEHYGGYWTKTTVQPHHLQILECDMLFESTITRCVQSLTELDVDHLDYAVINAGVLAYPNVGFECKGYGNTESWRRTYEQFAYHLHTNTIGPVIFANKLLQSRVTIGKVVFISSDSGSVSAFREHEDGFAGYGASKAALNQAARHMAAELKRRGNNTTILLLHPGEVSTDMAKIDLDWEVEGQMSPPQSVSACISTIESKTSKDSGTFWTWENKEYPW